MLTPISLRTDTPSGSNEVYYHGNFYGYGNFCLFYKFTDDKITGVTRRENVHLVNKLPDARMWCIFRR